MSRLRRAFTSEKKPATPVEVIPRPKTLTAAQQKEAANDKYWQEVEDSQLELLSPSLTGSTGGPGGVPIKGKGREIERLWGLENFGNTCYCNSVLQALFACQPFRQFVESYPNVPPPIAALGPPPGSPLFQAIPPNQRVTVDSFGLPLPTGGPSSPVANKGNPFDNPATNAAAKATSPTGGKEKRSWGLGGRKSSVSAASGGGGGNPLSIQTTFQTPTSTGGVPATPSAAAKLDMPIVIADPNRAPPTVFEAIQTLFSHLLSSLPHQPITVKKPAETNSQTASLLPAQPAEGANPATPNGGPQSPTAGKSPEVPQGPPLLASLPPPSAPRGGGPYAAGSLGRGVVRPEDLLKTVKSANEMFRGMAQQDAHEFLGWLLNRVAEEIEMLDKGLRAEGKEVTEAKGFGKTFVQNLFEGVLTNETRCLSCETTSSRDELFLDLSIDIEQHTSVTSCLRQFSASEMLCQKNKFFCDSCCGLQEAEKRMKIKRLPNVLALHLKRFKYQEQLGRYTKLFYRVPFPLELKLPNTSDDVVNPDRLYKLFAVVVHIGNGPHHGHYVALVKSAGRWVMCDDENVEPIDEVDVFRYFGDYPSGAGYVLFYQAEDLDLKELGMKNPPKPPSPPSETIRRAKPAPAPVAVAVESERGVSQPTNLMDLEEEEHIPSSPKQEGKHIPSSSPTITTSPIRPKVDIPASPTATNGHMASPVPISSVSRSASVANGTRTPSVERPLGRAPSTAPSFKTDSSSVKSKEKEGSKWLSRMTGKDKDSSKESKRSSMINGSSVSPATGTPPPRPSRQTTATSINSSGPITPTASGTNSNTTFGGLGVNVPTSKAGDNAQTVHGTVTPTSSISPQTPAQANGNTVPPSASSAIAPPVLAPVATALSTPSKPITPTQPPSPSVPVSASKPPTNLGRLPSTSPSTTNRDRTTSTSSGISNSAGGAGSGYQGGGSLGRKLSGMSGKFKMGFGKKSKDKDGREREGIEEEEREGRRGLLN